MFIMKAFRYKHMTERRITMKYKSFILLSAVLLWLLTLYGCSAGSGSPASSPSDQASAGAETISPSVSVQASASPSGDNSELPVFTPEQLSQYDGQNGNPAYVAVDGVVYDVTDVPQWLGGLHNGHAAGQDLSEAMSSSPHGKAVLDMLPVVGTLQD